MLERGEIVLTADGQIETVLYAEDRRVFTVENTSGWYHPTKVLRVGWEDIPWWMLSEGRNLLIAKLNLRETDD